MPSPASIKELLANPDIQALIVAVPDHWHKQIVVDAVTAGKDVYCEKPMSHTVADGAAMVAAAKKSGRIVQIGSQRTSSALLAKAKQLYDAGAIGELLSVELSLGRNDPTGAWEYPPPPGLSPENLDWDTWLGTAPKKPFDPITYARWRCWKEYGTGVAGDLMVHLVSGMMFVTGMNQAPTRAFSTGGIVRWKDGRNMPDLQAAIFEYGSVPAYVRLTLGTETQEMTRLMGPKGMLEIREREFTYTPQRGIDTAPSYYAQGFPAAMRTTYDTDWREEPTTPRPAKSSSPKPSPIAALRMTTSRLTCGTSWRPSARASRWCKTPSSATTPPPPATWPTRPTSRSRSLPGTSHKHDQGLREGYPPPPRILRINTLARFSAQNPEPVGLISKILYSKNLAHVLGTCPGRDALGTRIPFTLSPGEILRSGQRRGKGRTVTELS